MSAIMEVRDRFGFPRTVRVDACEHSFVPSYRWRGATYRRCRLCGLRQRLIGALSSGQWIDV